MEHIRKPPRGSDTRSAVRSLVTVLRAHTAALQANTAAQAAVCESQAKQYQELHQMRLSIDALRWQLLEDKPEMPSTVDNWSDPVKERIEQIEARISQQMREG